MQRSEFQPSARPLDDIVHYQRIVKIFAEADRIMREIELPLES
jgi:hypothetical protein